MDVDPPAQKEHLIYNNIEGEKTTVVPKEKKSSAGVEGTTRRRDDPAALSSVDTLAFPFVIEAGTNRFGFA